MFESNRKPLQMCYVPCSVFDRNIVKETRNLEMGTAQKYGAQKNKTCSNLGHRTYTLAMIFLTSQSLTTKHPTILFHFFSY